MKNISKLFGIVGLAVFLVFSMAACGDEVELTEGTLNLTIVNSTDLKSSTVWESFPPVLADLPGETIVKVEVEQDGEVIFSRDELEIEVGDQQTFSFKGALVNGQMLNILIFVYYEDDLPVSTTLSGTTVDSLNYSEFSRYRIGFISGPKNGDTLKLYAIKNLWMQTTDPN